ncbi:MAG TPA: hypothetical protein VGI60_09465 [Chthoniobacterales bacterium]|jgi:uncharacterized delta-60 repeat protein
MKTDHLPLTLIAIISSTLSLVVPIQVQAAAGDLDPAFGRGGLAQTDFARTDEYGFAVKVQPDGRIVVGGQSGTYPVFHAALARYNTNGRLDRTFGTGGKTTAALDSGGDGAQAIALQPDGKIVTAGSVIHNNFTLAFILGRFNADGSLDQTFGNHGSIQTTFGDPSAEGNDVVLQSDGKIIVVGSSGAGSYSALNDFAIARYNANGTIDQSYGNGGKVTTHFPGVFNTGSTAFGAILQADSKLVVAGTYVNEATPNAFALARYNVDGSLDTSFGNAGLVTTRIGSGSAFALGVVLQRDGRIVLAGYSDTRTDHDFTLACYNSNGTLDQTFGAGGAVTTNFAGNNSDDIAYAIALQRDGKLVVGGRTGEYPVFDFGVARYTSAGQLDQGFGVGGVVTTDLGNEELGYGIAVQRDGKILLSGGVFNGSTFDMGVVRYLGR